MQAESRGWIEKTRLIPHIVIWNNVEIKIGNYIYFCLEMVEIGRLKLQSEKLYPAGYHVKGKLTVHYYTDYYLFLLVRYYSFCIMGQTVEKNTVSLPPILCSYLHTFGK